MAIETFYRDSWVEINLDAIAHNIKQIRNHIPDDKQIYAVVKANAYGHGDVQVAKKAMEAGADALAVSLLDEALRLRNQGITAPILVMGWIRSQDAPIAAANNISVTFFQKEWLQEVKHLDLPRPLKLHLKWDSGMGRVGIRHHEELAELLTELDDDRILLEGVFTHFATADEADFAYFERQRRSYDDMRTLLKEKWQQPVAFHSSNSATSLRFPEQEEDMLRFGISLYGLYPSPVVKEEHPVDLQPAFSLHSRLVHVKEVKKGDCISYGATYCAEEDEWIGTVPLGYADGWIRQLQGMDVLIDGKRMPIVGRICMDQFMVKLDHPYQVGEKVTLIGKQGKEEIPMDEIAAYLHTINYEIPCIISSRVPRIYYENGQLIEVKNPVTS
ncbi:alanine racemase 1 [Thalassobacillus devorans]|uniref:Alanine racemase n=1 Tax=Thalassobacillus devorans TaxID=279813 RepID=A0ABQ1PWA1_9BACI|nr:alanine racemase [Thalassobacillus devorans]NIK30883.1 alanine racemase [Thalassobacillus devorans]GGD05015.1 alanine racemase 1 [Thalassobacillus devorans]